MVEMLDTQETYCNVLVDSNCHMNEVLNMSQESFWRL